MGFEPTNGGFAIRCVSHFAIAPFGLRSDDSDLIGWPATGLDRFPHHLRNPRIPAITSSRVPRKLRRLDTRTGPLVRHVLLLVMETVLTIPVRCTVVFAIAALVGTSALRIMRHLDAPPDQILAQKVVRQSSDASESADEQFRSLPGELFIPFVMAGLLLFSWQALDFSKLRKQSKTDNLSDYLESRKSPRHPKVRR